MGEMLQDAYMKKDKYKTYSELSACDKMCLEDAIYMMHMEMPFINNEEYDRIIHRLQHIYELITKE